TKNSWTVSAPAGSLAVRITCCAPVSAAVGVHVTRPVAGSTLRPMGPVFRPKVILAPVLDWARAWYCQATPTTACAGGVDVITGGWSTSPTTTWNDCTTTRPWLSAARSTTVWSPASSAVGTQTTTPVTGSTAMPAGWAGRSKASELPSGLATTG